VKLSQLALVQGTDDTRAALRRWNAAPIAALVPCALGALAISAGLLLSVLAVAHIAEPDSTRLLRRGVLALGQLFLQSPLLHPGCRA
jgi:hypothetical protein